MLEGRITVDRASRDYIMYTVSKQEQENKTVLPGGSGKLYISARKISDWTTHEGRLLVFITVQN